MLSNAPPYLYESVDGYSVVTLHSSLNDVQWADIERIGSSLLAQIAPIKTPIVLVDLGSLNYMGSAMVALVVRVWKAVNERQGRMVVANRNEMVLEVLRLAGLAKVWTIVPSREDGLKELGAGARRTSSNEGSGAGVLSVIAMAAAGCALIGAVAPLVAPGKLSHEVAQMLALAGSASATVFGLILIMKSKGLTRGVGVLAVVLAVVAVGLRTMNNAAPAANREEGKPVTTETPSPGPAPTATPETPPAVVAPGAAVVPAVPETVPPTPLPGTGAPAAAPTPGVGKPAADTDQPAEAETPETAKPSDAAAAEIPKADGSATSN